MSASQPRTETDSFGSIDVLADALWGAQTARSLRFFAIGDQRMPVEMVHALAQVKRAAAEVNGDLGPLESARAAAVAALTGLRVALHAKAEAFSGVLKVGRTHMQDAAPVTFGHRIRPRQLDRPPCACPQPRPEAGRARSRRISAAEYDAWVDVRRMSVPG